MDTEVYINYLTTAQEVVMLVLQLLYLLVLQLQTDPHPEQSLIPLKRSRFMLMTEVVQDSSEDDDDDKEEQPGLGDIPNNCIQELTGQC